MKKTYSGFVFVLLLILFLVFMNSCGDSPSTPSEKTNSESASTHSSKTMRELFSDEGGVVAYKVSRKYGSPFYEIIDLNNNIGYRFGGEIEGVLEFPITSITENSFKMNGRKYEMRDNSISSLSGDSIKTEKATGHVSLSKVDLKSAEALLESIRQETENGS